MILSYHTLFYFNPITYFMAYLFKKISDCIPGSRPKYFFDANVWIAALKSNASLKIDYHEQPYINFFDAVITLNSYDTESIPLKKLTKQGLFQPKIIMTSLLMSEIFNAYIKGVAYETYLSQNGLSKNDLKFKDYRQMEDHENQLSTLKSDFLAFYDYMELWDDNFKNINPKSICTQLGSQADFNDHYYYDLFVDDGIPIVTGDGDFKFQDLEIITNRPNLLKLAS